MSHICSDPHCHDPHCSGHHHHHAHEDAPEHAAVFAAKRTFAPAAPVSRKAIEETAAAVFRAIGEGCCIDGILPGHAKGLIEAAEGGYSLSLTSLDRIDTQTLGAWAAQDTLEGYTVTINVHLVIPHALQEDALFAPFEALG